MHASLFGAAVWLWSGLLDQTPARMAHTLAASVISTVQMSLLGALITVGDLVFYGTMDGWFKANDARTGQLKWQFKTGSGIIGQLIAYKGPNGREYVAVLSGVGGWAGAIVPGNLDPRDPTGALCFVGAMGDLKKTTAEGMLYVFALPPS